MIADHDGWSDERIARKVRRALIIHLANESMAISGPRMKPANLLQREILERKKFRAQLAVLAEENRLSPNEALQKCTRYLKKRFLRR